jgi:glucose/arabinose dehydrogenase
MLFGVVNQEIILKKHMTLLIKIYCAILFGLLFFLTFLSSCMQREDAGGEVDKNIVVVEAFPNLSFTRPVDLQHSGDDSDRLFVVEQRGVISVFKANVDVSNKSTFLDISTRVKDQGNEEGLLGLAFHPQFSQNGYFFVNYTAANPNRTVISRFQTNSDGYADANSEIIILEFNQPFSNHNGGQLAFGPDGMLYIAVGDGGSGGDPQNHGQNTETLLGTILRINVDEQSGQRNYSVPADNPFINTEGFRDEIFAYGLRNPWRFSFDPVTKNLWTGDVGQNRLEEINIITSGGNYGWNIMEGRECFNPMSGCDKEGLELPVWQYGRAQGDVSVTGGYVYRGKILKQLEGLYIYADFASGRVWSLDVNNIQNPVNKEIVRASFPVSSFGVDKDNELYLCGFDDKIYKLAYE